MNTYWISLPCDLLSSLASFQCSLLHHLHLSSDLGLSKYVNQHSHLNLSRNVRLSVLYDLDFNKSDPCIWLRKAPNLRCYEYIAVYVDDLCIAAEFPSAIIQIFKSKYHLKVKGDGKFTYHLGADYFEDPDGTFVSQPKKYIDKLADTYNRLFNEEPPKGYKTPLDKNDHPELDTSEILEGDMAAKYLTMVG